MRIVQVVESTATGTLSMVSLIANRFAAAGHEVHVIYSARPDTPAALHALFGPRVTLRCLPMRGRALFVTLVALRRALIALDPQVVHLHSSFAGFAGRLATLGALRDAALFYSPHCIAFMRRDVSRAMRVAFVALERIACMRACRYVACSDSERDAVRSRLRQAVAVVENAVEPLPAARWPRRACDAARPLDVVTVGGVRPQKDPHLFAEIAQRLRGDAMRFTWIGDGSASHADALRAAGVEVTGWRARADVLRRLADADVYLSTSAWEGMPVSVIEAMSAGVAVVATRCSGNVDALAHLRTGLLFRDADEAIACLRALRRNRALCARLGRAARAVARARFAPARFIAELERLYRDGSGLRD
ncbi:glycosyltransferase [Burkholderia guangdongensis]|uniref:glycosyltransferase n=1 Tax=Burkholderia guangdongensis TaxID=1792500 RepID=UPI0015CC81C0|nr:glycosyltransferase [Burkholderia guangdongensis]